MTDAYNPATRPCASGTTKGCGYLQRAILGYWPAATNLGTFICRPTADGAPSVHGNGRAGDIGRDLALIIEIAGWLVANHTVLGVQLVIVNHKIWSVARSSEGWRPYGCDDPGSEKDHHTTHVHYEVNVDAGHYLTPGTIDSVRPHQPPNPDPQPEEDLMHKIWKPVGAGQPHVGGEYIELGDTFVILSAADKQQLANSEADGDTGKLHVQDAEPGLWKRITQDYTKVIT